MAVGRPFRKGQSGNPGGRPKADAVIAELAKAHTEDALRALVTIANKGKSESARVSASVALLDRAWGKPTQPIEGDFGRRSADEMTDDELAALIQPDAPALALAAAKMTDTEH